LSSRRARRRRREAPMPAAGAGLLRFFEEETLGLKLKPEIVLVFAISLIVLCILAQIYYL